MKVSELIALLQQQDPDQYVHMEVPSHDYWGTMLAIPLGGLEVMPVSHSAYHDRGAIHYEHEHSPVPDNATPTLILKEFQ